MEDPTASSFNKGKKGFKGRGYGVPNLEEFHGYLQTLFPSTSVDYNNDSSPSLTFTKGAVLGLRQIYWKYLQVVSSNLAKQDTLDDDDVVAQALSINPAIAELVIQVRNMLATPSSQIDQGRDTTISNTSKRKRKRSRITAEMEIEQDRLLQESRANMLQKKSQQQQAKTG